MSWWVQNGHRGLLSETWSFQMAQSEGSFPCWNWPWLRNCQAWIWDLFSSIAFSLLSFRFFAFSKMCRLDVNVKRLIWNVKAAGGQKFRIDSKTADVPLPSSCELAVTDLLIWKDVRDWLFSHGDIAWRNVIEFRHYQSFLPSHCLFIALCQYLLFSEKKYPTFLWGIDNRKFCPSNIQQSDLYRLKLIKRTASLEVSSFTVSYSTKQLVIWIEVRIWTIGAKL